jgi:acetyl-CoA carboxylase, biotin carboxylase subunit
VYLERLIERPRHIEFQVMGDRHGKVLHLGERECSIQRRHQKLIEESPSPCVDSRTREELGAKVVAALQKIGYSGAGTVEFLRDESGKFYFIEMNTRIQVEHPVTEMVTDIDLVKAQIRLAAGEKLRDVVPRTEIRGHSIECRINAEDPETFVPSAGHLTAFYVPGGKGVRVDTAMHSDASIPPYYDSLVAKLIVLGADRQHALLRMQRALEMFIVEGVKTTLPLHRRILADAEFQAGRIHTGFLDRLLGSAKSPAPGD